MDETVARYKCISEKEGRGGWSANPIQGIPVDSIVDRPLCTCHYLSEVKLSKDKSKIYFVCALKNVWDNFFSDLHIDKPCDFWKLYTEDIKLKEQYEIVKERSREKWVLNIPFSMYKIHPEPCICCNKTGYLPIFRPTGILNGHFCYIFFNIQQN